MKYTIAFLLCTLTVGVTGAQSTPTIYEGFTEASRDILVSGSELGRLQQVAVRMGDRVKEGDLIAQMDDVQQRATVRLSRARAAMTGDLDLAVEEETMYRERTEQLRELVRRNLARPDEVKRSESQWRMAIARVKQANEQRELHRLQLERDLLLLERRRITAPASGVISRVLRWEGEYVTPADSAIVRLLVVDVLEGTFNIPAEDVSNVRLGQEVSLLLRSCSETAKGVINRISPSIEGKSGTVQIRVRIPNFQHRYMHGDRCTLRIMHANQRRGAEERSTDEESANEGSEIDRITLIRPSVKILHVSEADSAPQTSSRRRRHQ